MTRGFPKEFAQNYEYWVEYPLMQRGRLAQRERASFTRKRSLVQTQ